MTNKEIAKEIRTALKKEMPDTKFSVRVNGGDEIVISLMEAPFDIFTNQKNPNYDQINHYTLTKYDSYEDYNFADTHPINDLYNFPILTKEAWETLRKATLIANDYREDRSEPQVDYFDCNFYLSIEVGKYNKPYSVNKKEEAK